MRTFFVTIFGALLLVGCAQQPQPAPRQAERPTAVLAHAVPAESLCTIGQGVNKTLDHVYIEVLVVNDDAAVVQIVDGKRNPGQYGQAIFDGVRSGRIPRFEGEKPITFNLLNMGRMPNHVSYLQGEGYCGAAEVKRVGPRAYDVTVMVRGGDGLGQVSLVLPLEPVAATLAPGVCVEGSALQYLPALTKGSFKGRPSTSCSLPGSRAGTTDLGEDITRGKRSTKFALVYGVGEE